MEASEKLTNFHRPPPVHNNRDTSEVFVELNNMIQHVCLTSIRRVSHHERWGKCFVLIQQKTFTCKILCRRLLFGRSHHRSRQCDVFEAAEPTSQRMKRRFLCLLSGWLKSAQLRGRNAILPLVHLLGSNTRQIYVVYVPRSKSI